MNGAKGIIKVSITDNSYYSVCVFTHVSSSEAGSKPKCHMDENDKQRLYHSDTLSHVS